MGIKENIKEYFRGKKEDIKENPKEFLIGGLIVLVLGYAAIKPFVNEYQLNNSDYIARTTIYAGKTGFGNTLYGYDDNKEGNIDRIIELGSAGLFARLGFAASRPYKRTLNIEHDNFQFYLNELLKSKFKK